MKKTFSLIFSLFLTIAGFFCYVRFALAADYLAEYWDTAAVATPSMPGTAAESTTTVSSINFNWGTGGPIGTGDGFIARYTKIIGTGEYSFSLGSDDGSRVFIDNVSVLNMWIDQGYTTASTNYTASTSGNHDLRIEYYENGGDARLTFSYARTIYANSLTGSDTTGAGTLASPYKTYTKASSQAEVGDTINAKYILTYSASSGGSLTGSTTQTVANVNHGSSITAVPNTGYHFVNWSDASTTNPRIDYGFNDVTVTANFAIDTHTVSYAAGSGGSITGSSSQIVNYSSSTSAVTATPDVGYYFTSWNDASTTNPRIDYNITATTTHTASFATSSYALTYTAGSGGTLSGSSTQTVNYGADGSAVTAVPDTGYSFVDWSDASTTNPRTDYNITATTSITANFSINTFTLSYTAGTGGSISGSASQTVNYNSDGSAVTAMPANGYVFLRWSDGSTVNPRTDTNVTANLSVTANFSSVGSSSLTPVSSIGTGITDIAIPMNEQREISEVKPVGTNILAYIGSTGGFNVTVSQTRTVATHSFKIIGIDMIGKIITVQIMSEPQIVELGVGDVKKIDLDGDRVSDMSLSFNQLVNNRIDLTINQLAFDSSAQAKAMPAESKPAKTEIVATAKKPMIAKYNFTKNLEKGNLNNDVKELQKYLNTNGFTVAKTGPGSIGQETNYFGQATKKALIKFQQAKKIKPAAGYFGPVTRKVIDKIL